MNILLFSQHIRKFNFDTQIIISYYSKINDKLVGNNVWHKQKLDPPSILRFKAVLLLGIVTTDPQIEHTADRCIEPIIVSLRSEFKNVYTVDTR